MNDKKKKRLQISLPVKLADNLLITADDMGIPVSTLCTMIISDYLRGRKIAEQLITNIPITDLFTKINQNHIDIADPVDEE